MRYTQHPGLLRDELRDAPPRTLSILNHGYLPQHRLASDPARMLRACVEDYLKRVTHLDTGFLVRALVSGTADDEACHAVLARARRSR